MPKNIRSQVLMKLRRAVHMTLFLRLPGPQLLVSAPALRHAQQRPHDLSCAAKKPQTPPSNAEMGTGQRRWAERSMIAKG
jgi:hypothetical protein